ncbi:MAG: YadA-like family protein [Phascolarctobacterium sp.]|nr:YadA-like family protein [Candidatus Phascolarctobacterium caballi]
MSFLFCCTYIVHSPADAYTASATVSGSSANLTLTSKVDTTKTITFWLVAGDNITFAQDGNNIKISATDGTGGGSGSQSDADVLVHKGGDTDQTAIIGGTNTEAIGKNALALGNSSKANAENTVSIGYGNETAAANSTAVGSGNKVSGEKSTAVGYGNIVSGSRSGAFGDPNNITGSGSYALGNDNTVSGDNTFVIGNGVTATSNNSVILGNGSADGGANTVSVGAAGSERKIVNVAPGTNDTDAVNYGQLQAALGATGSGEAFYALQDKVENMENRIDKMGTRINKVGAGAAALAAMHPICDDDCNLTFSAGLGSYKGERAVAMGMFYRFNPRIMMNCGAAVGNDNNMYNLGFNIALDKCVGEKLPSKAVMAKELNALRDVVAEQDAKIAKLTAMGEEMSKKKK